MTRTLGSAVIGSADETGFPQIGGVIPSLLSFPAFAADEALRIRPASVSDAPITAWAIGLDVYIPQPAGTFVSLIQTGDGDGDLFLSDNGDGTAGIGVAGVYDGAVPFDAWTRIIATFTEDGGSTILRKYVDGALVGTQDLGATTRWTIDPAVGLKLFADDDGETAAGAVSSVFFTTQVPPPADVAALVASIAAPNATGFFPAAPSSAAVELTFAGEDLTLKYGDADVFLDGFGFRTPAVINESAIALASQFGIDGPGGTETPVLDYPAYRPDEGLLVKLPGFGGDLASYTAVWDIRVDALPGFQALLQTDVTNSGDGDLFIDGAGGIGIGGNYDGAVTAEEWARIAVTVEDRGDGTSLLSKYLDGTFLDSQSVDTARFTLSAATGFLLLSDDGGETAPGYLAHFGLSEEVLDAAAVAALGGADGDGPFDEQGAANTPLTLRFASHWRPFDNQTAQVLVSFDGGAPVEIFRYDSTNTDDNAQRNETVEVDFLAPEGAEEVQLSFRLSEADNDWYWAVDNIELAAEDGTVLLSETFDSLAGSLEAAVDEATTTIGWTHTPPAGWDREVDAETPAGTTEWRGWSFVSPAFWQAADGQARDEFTKGTGVIAVADPDEWDDFNGGAGAELDSFDTTLRSPAVSLAGIAPEPTSEEPAPQTYQVGFDGYEPTVEFGFQSVELIDLPEEEPIQDNIDDLIVREGTPATIDLLAAFGAGASGFAVTSEDGAVIDAAIAGTTLTLTPGALGHSDVIVTAVGEDGTELTENFRAIVAGENAYVFAVIPDTQDYTSNPGITETFGNMTDWLIDQKDSLGIEHVIHVGDIVQFGAASQWEIAKDAMERLDGIISYTLNVGNHDQQRPGFSSAFSFESDIDAYFTPEQVGATAAQGGGTYDGFDVGPDTFGNGSTYADSVRNHYTTLETRDGTEWLILSLEFGMPDDVLRWAGEVIEGHLDHRVIIDTHSWNGGDGRVNPTTQPLTTDNGGWGYGIRDNPRNVNDGEDAWRELASKYPNVTFTFNGHNFMGGAETVVSYGAGGNPAHQIFVNYQDGAWAGVPGVGTNGGNGAIRYLVIDPDNDRFTTHTKLVELDTYYDAFPDHEETFENVEFGAPEEITIAKAGETEIVTGDGVTATVTLDPSATLGDTAGATFEWFAADGETLGESDGDAIDVDLKTGTNRVTLVVTDAAGNVSTDDKVVIVEAPDALLTDTFDDGDLAGWTAPEPDLSSLVTLGTDVGFALPAIDPGAAQIALNLTFASHWRPFDNQTATVAVSFDGGAPVEILRYDSANTDDTSQRNETISLDFLAPASASEVEVLWRYDDADNDWYWAIDEVVLTATGGTTPTELLAEDFDSLAATLDPAVDEAIPATTLGWTHDGPAGWARTVDPASPAGTTEWRGWSFVTPEFWVAADVQARDEFTKGTGVIAVADGDEWDDFNGGAGGDTDSLDTTLATPAVSLAAVGGGVGSGTEAGVVRVPALAGNEGILVTPGASGEFNTYTLVFDVLASPTTKDFTALFQTDPANADDAEIYLRNDGATASIGISGDYDGALAYGDWGRIALVFETDAAGEQTLSKYLDGVLLGSQVVDSDVADGSRWTIDADAGFLLLSEPNGFTSEVYANAVAFTPDALTAGEIAGLGGVDVDGPLAGSANPDAFQLNFDGSLDGVDFGTAGVEPVSIGGGATSYLVKGSVFGNPDGEGEAALYQQSDGGNEILLWSGAGSETWTNYVYDVTVEPADNDTIGALFYVAGPDTYYELSLDQENDLRILNRVEDGVVTELARETASYRHFAMQDLRIAVIDGTITATLDDELLFDGPVTDADPLAGGTVGILSRSMDRVLYDNVSVNPATLAARALTTEPEGRWAADRDGDGTAEVAFTAAATLSLAGVASTEWLVEGDVVATGETVTLALAAGETTVHLRVTDVDGLTSEDQVTVEVAASDAILLDDDFDDGEFAGWTVVDEGTIDGPSDWSVVGGELVQATNIRSTQQGTGSTAFSVAGDGPFILRDGTYALWDTPAAYAWTDYAVEATITPDDDDGIGLLFRYTDAENYYKLEADAETGLVTLTRHLDGRESILARGWHAYTPGEAQDWRIEVAGGRITAFIDGKEVFGTDIEDRTLLNGTVGLYGWGSENLAFDDVLVTGLDPVNVVDGTDGDDTDLRGTSGRDLISARAGNDRAFGFDGSDTLLGGRGDDTLNGGAGDDSVRGGRGDDLLFGGDGDDVARGGRGDDKIVGGAGDDTLTGNAADDVLEGGAGADHLVGGIGDDTLVIDGDDVAAGLVDGGDGRDLIRATRSDTPIVGLDMGAANAEAFVGSAGDDVVATSGAVSVYLSGRDGNDDLFGGDGDDKLLGGAGSDTLAGGAGDDTLLGEDASDVLFGGAGDDRLFGGGGDDTLNGGLGNDIFAGGAGDDVLVFDTLDYGSDRVSDFASGDTVLFDAALGLTTADFTVGAAGSNALLSGGEGILRFFAVDPDDLLLQINAGTGDLEVTLV